MAQIKKTGRQSMKIIHYRRCNKMYLKTAKHITKAEENKVSTSIASLAKMS